MGKAQILRWFLIFVLTIVSYFYVGNFSTLLADSANLAPNPSFETGVSVPDGWITLTQGFGCGYTTTPPALTYDWDSTQAHSGARSVALKNISWPTGTTFTPGGWISSDFIPALPYPQEYEVSVWVLGASSNINLRPILFICQYGETGNVVTSGGFSSLNLPGTNWIRISVNLRGHSSLAKIKLGLGVKCSSSAACSGSLWFDDVNLRMVGKITAHKFEDLNRNGQQDVGEQNLAGWRMNVFRGSGCTGDWVGSGITDTNGNQTFAGRFSYLPLGEYSVAEVLQDGWDNTTPLCQNVNLVAGQIPQINFGNVQSSQPIVPYFSQIDSLWGSQEYDHANSLNLWCGSTIAQCGCAVTSAAMLLRYYGVDRSPTGESTDPGTLNNWLKVSKNKGYINGNVDWFAVVRYSKQAHNIYGTPIIDYVLPNLGENFLILNQELENGRPVILKEPGHFIVATGITGQTYLINDPRWQNRETLQSYGNHFQEMRRFVETHSNLSGILIASSAPVEFLVTDQLGRKAGRDPITGEFFNDIPNATYHLETPLIDDTFEDTLMPPASNGTFLFEAADPESGQYQVLVSGSNNTTVSFRGYDQDGEVSEQILSTTGITEYVMEYSSVQGSQINISQTVDIDIKPGSDTNSVNLKSNGVIPVAILTTPSFDATQVDVSTIKFGSSQATETHGKGHFEDIDNDGDTDLVLHFKTQETGIQDTDTQACLTGITLSGVPIQGCNSIQIVPK